MKKRLLVMAGAILLFACNETESGNLDSDDNGKDHVAMHNANTEKQKTILRAIETGDVSAVDTVLSDNIIDHEGNMGKDIVGKDSVMHYLSSIHNYFDGLKIELMHDATSPDGDYYFALVKMTGTAKQNPWGMPVGEQFEDTGIDLVKIENGKASEHWSFTSMKDMMEMMNMKPQ